MSGHDICDDCGWPVEPSRRGGRRRVGKDGRRRCIACQRWRIRPVLPDALCADCGRIVEANARGRRRRPGGDGARRCAACQQRREAVRSRERSRLSQRRRRARLKAAREEAT